MPRSFFNWAFSDCEISGQEPSSVLVNDKTNSTFLVFDDDSEGEGKGLRFFFLHL